MYKYQTKFIRYEKKKQVMAADNCSKWQKKKESYIHTTENLIKLGKMLRKYEKYVKAAENWSNYLEPLLKRKNI